MTTTKNANVRNTQERAVSQYGGGEETIHILKHEKVINIFLKQLMIIFIASKVFYYTFYPSSVF